MSDFSGVDSSANAHRLVGYLDATDVHMAPIKTYIVAAAALASPQGLILDLGCGLGHDLARLHTAGMRAVGIDSSRVMLSNAAARGRPLLQAGVESLPVADASVDGCRIERVLQHVADPARVLTEVARVLRPHGFLAVLEPDFSMFQVASDVPDHEGLLAGLLRAPHPAVGGRLCDLLHEAGFRVDNVITETSHSYSFDRLPVAATVIISRAVAEGRLAGDAAEQWLAEQHARSASGTFRACWDKVLVIATR